MVYYNIFFNKSLVLLTIKLYFLLTILPIFYLKSTKYNCYLVEIGLKSLKTYRIILLLYYNHFSTTK